MLSVATGYLRSEYRALGVDFDERNDLFDEALEVIRGVWTDRRLRLRGPAFHRRRAVTPTRSRAARRRSGSAATAACRGGGSRRSATGGARSRPRAGLATTAKTPPLETTAIWRRCSTNSGSTSTKRVVTARPSMLRIRRPAAPPISMPRPHSTRSRSLPRSASRGPGCRSWRLVRPCPRSARGVGEHPDRAVSWREHIWARNRLTRSTMDLGLEGAAVSSPVARPAWAGLPRIASPPTAPGWRCSPARGPISTPPPRR